MPLTRSELHELVDQMPEAEIAAATRFLQFLSRETIGPVFGESIRRGIAEADKGETVVCHGYEEMVERVLGKD